MQTFCHLIDGEVVAGRHDFEVVNPSIGAPFARCPDPTREEVDAAMAAAALRARADVPAPRRRTRGARAAGEARGRPINNRPQFERVQELVDDARRAGGTVEVGGAPLSRPGYFYPPTLVTGVGEGVRLVDEEHFGTALPVISYADVEDAIAQANRSHYGLGGPVWTADVRRREDLAQRLECGTAWVNQHIDTGAFAPFGGMKWSGIGRENGRWGIEEFCELQVVSTRLA